MVTVAVDAGGADLGPGEVAAGAASAAAQGIGVLLFGPAAEIGSVPSGVEVVDAPVSIAKATRSGVRRPLDARGVDRPGRPGGRRRSRPGARLRRLDRVGARRRPVQPATRPRHLPAGARAARADARRRAGAAARRRRERHLPPRAPRPVRAHGLGVRAGGDGDRLAARRAALQRRGAGEGHARARRGPRAARRRRRHRAELRRQHRGHAGDRRRRRRRRDGRLHRQHHAEADRGRLRPDDARDPRRRDELGARAKLGGWLLAPAVRAAARGDRSREDPAAPTCSDCASSAWSPTDASPAGASRARSRSQRAGVAGGRDRPHARGARAGRRAAPAEAESTEIADGASSEPTATVSSR